MQQQKKIGLTSGDTKASHEVPEDGEDGCLPIERRSEGSPNGENGCRAEDDDICPIKVVDQVVQGDWRESLLSGEGVLYVVVGDVLVDGDVLLDLFCGSSLGGHWMR